MSHKGVIQWDWLLRYWTNRNPTIWYCHRLLPSQAGLLPNNYWNTCRRHRHTCIEIIFICTRGLFVNSFNSSPTGQNGRHVADNIFNRIFLNENVSISIQISLKFVCKGQVDNKSALVQVMAWRWTGDKPLPKFMLTQFTDADMRH